MPDDNEGEGRRGLQLTHPQAVNRQRDLDAEIDRLSLLDDPTEEEEARFNQAVEEYNEIDKWRKHLERQAARAQVRQVTEGELRTASTRFGQPGAVRVERGAGSMDTMDVDSIMEPDSVELGRFKNPWDLSQMRTFDRSSDQIVAEYRARALSAVGRMHAATDRVRSTATDLIETHDDEQGNLSRLALTLSDPVYLRAWSKMARDPNSATLEEDERRAINRVQQLARAMSLTDAAGGYLVPFQLDPTVILTSAGSFNQVRRLARQVIATTDVWHGVSAGAVSWGYRAEAAEAGDDAPSFAQPTVPIHTADGFVPISVEALADAANVTSEVGNLLAVGKEDLEAAAFATGTGSGQPTGIVTALVASSPSVIVASAGANVFAVADVYATRATVPARYRGRPNVGWLANNLTYDRIRQFDTAGGGQMFGTLTDDRPERLLGAQVMEAEAMDATFGSGENYILIFGDWSNYVIADRIGTTVEFIPHLFGANQRPTGQRGWWAYVRHGADSVNDQGFAILNIT